MWRYANEQNISVHEYTTHGLTRKSLIDHFTMDACVTISFKGAAIQKN